MRKRTYRQTDIQGRRGRREKRRRRRKLEGRKEGTKVERNRRRLGEREREKRLFPVFHFYTLTQF
jgi:hypothetical protein